MNNWGISEWLENEVIARDTHCIYCGITFSNQPEKRGDSPSWEHIINDAKLISKENIARCCISCNSSKGSKTLESWLKSKYCERKLINYNRLALVAKQHLNNNSNANLS